MLGTGGMGMVVTAYDPQLDRRVALKMLRGDLLREAQAMARLNHPNVVAVYEVVLVDDGGYVVMDAGRRTDVAHVADRAQAALA